MEIEIVRKHDNVLLERVEIDFRIKHAGENTPSRDAVRDSLKEILNLGKETLVVDSFEGSFGKGETQGSAKVYKTLEKAKYVEEKHMLLRNKLIEKEKKK